MSEGFGVSTTFVFLSFPCPYFFRHQLSLSRRVLSRCGLRARPLASVPISQTPFVAVRRRRRRRRDVVRRDRPKCADARARFRKIGDGIKRAADALEIRVTRVLAYRDAACK